jgi:hypothetical protein
MRTTEEISRMYFGKAAEFHEEEAACHRAAADGR